VNGVVLNGAKVDKTYITHEEPMGGGNLYFEMADQANHRKGVL
jgi:putative alpha-1,2-mannosidase